MARARRLMQMYEIRREITDRLTAEAVATGLTQKDLRIEVKAATTGAAYKANTASLENQVALLFDPGTFREIGLWSKMAGADIHHIGDAGFGGIAPPENIMALSIAVRGRRHTYRRMGYSMRK